MANNILPPGINGTNRGNLELNFKSFSPSISKDFNAHVKWWGQDKSAVRIITLKFGIHSRISLNYSVHTNYSQFCLYLEQCDNIEITLCELKSKIVFGTTKAKIPEMLFKPAKPNNFNANDVLFGTTKCSVINSRIGFVGYLEIKIMLLFYNKIKDEIIINPIKAITENKFHIRKPCEFTSTTSNTKTDEIKIMNSLSYLNKSLPHFTGTIPTTEQKHTSRSLTSLDKSVCTIIVNYLNGQHMSKTKEKKALSNICSISSPESLINAINNVPENSNNLPLSCEVCIHFKNMTLTRVGMSLTNPAILYYFVLELIVGRLQFKRFQTDSTVQIKDIKTVYKFNFNQHITLKSDLTNDHIYEFSIYLRQNGYASPTFLGSSIFNFNAMGTNVLETKLPIMCNKICHGKLNLEFIYLPDQKPASLDFNKENLNTSNTFEQALTSYKLKKTETPNPSSCNRDKQDENYDNKQNQLTTKNVADLTNCLIFDNNNMNLSNMNFDQNTVKVTMQQKPENFISFLEGLLHIGEMENVTPMSKSSYFIVCHSFWKDVTCIKIWQNNSVNYLDIFPILCNKEFLDRTRNNFLILELWQKAINTTEQLVGIIRLPLHKFYIAFSDTTVIEHLRQSKFPIISIDGWLPILSPLTNQSCGLLQVLLAIGTDTQIEYLKVTRNLQQLQNNIINELNFTALPNLKIPNFKINMETQISSRLKDNDMEINYATTTNITPEKIQKFSAAEKLNAFIDGLSQLRPTRTERELNLNVEVAQKGPQIRKTSDLLDMLHKALTEQPSSLPSLTTLTPPLPQPICTSNPSSPYSTASTSTYNQNIDINASDLFKVIIDIENAINLPKFGVKINKKNSKRGKGKNNRILINVEPSSYVTFHAIGINNIIGTVKTNDGPIYTTNIVEKSCNPQWKKSFEVLLPVELVTNNEEKLKLKVWTKQCTDIPQCRLTPQPSEDILIGTINVDLTVLLVGLPSLSGWFNVLDYAGRCNGQLKINIIPLQNLSRFREVNNLRFQTINDPNQTSKPIATNLLAFTASIPSAAATKIMTTSTNVVNQLPVIDTTCDLSSAFLSRALKRKFTELEEITERLKTRLQDITDECHHMELNDEFENDLNTIVNEDDDDDDDENINKITDEQQINFDWLKKNQLISKTSEFEINKDSANHQYDKIPKLYTIDDNNKKSKDITELSITKDLLENTQPQQSRQQRNKAGCTKSVSSNDLMEILKNVNLDTIINPNILKNVVNPSMVSTEHNTPRDLNIIIDEEILFTPSTLKSSESSLSEYRIKIISDALQKTVLTDTINDNQLLKSSRNNDIVSDLDNNDDFK